jgi:hypothetical protein
MLLDHDDRYANRDGAVDDNGSHTSDDGSFNYDDGLYESMYAKHLDYHMAQGGQIGRFCSPCTTYLTT